MSTREDFEAWAADVRASGKAWVSWEVWQAATSHQEAKIKALVEALEAGPSLMHTYPDKSKCLCSHCEFIRLKNTAIAAAKETS